MKALIQRVKSASVWVDDVLVGQIDDGVLAYIGIGKDDTPDTAKKLLDKIIHYRLFANPDKQGKLDYSLCDIKGGLLLVSQFTLMANTQNGRRADFSPAMPPNEAKICFDELVSYAKCIYPTVQTGQFGADMQVHTINDGPINFLLEV